MVQIIKEVIIILCCFICIFELRIAQIVPLHCEWVIAVVNSVMYMSSEVFRFFNFLVQMSKFVPII
jgi:hypothetical protein